MGSYTFKWESPAEEVFVTGTFDNWTKSEKLDKIGDIFKKTVFFKDASVKVYYKFVVDHAWIINESSPKEADHEGNVNNFLTPEDMASEEAVAPVIATVAAESTTAQLAGEQPIEKHEEPAVTEEKDEPSEVVENPEKNEKSEDDGKNDEAEKETVATPSDVPGGFPTTPSDDLDKIVSINPLPAADGAVNPIKLAPGEPIPDVFTESVTSHVKLDEASYEKADALPGIETSELQPPSAGADVVPESGLPVAVAAAAHINTVGPSTLALAAEVPLEGKVPEIVKESQEKAGFAPEASAVPEEVREKAEVEKELIEKIPEAPAASESGPAEVSEGTGIVVDGAAVASAEAASGDVAVEQAIPAPAEAPAAEAAIQEEKPTETVSEAPAEVKEPTQETEAKPEAVVEDAKVEEPQSKPVEESKAEATEETKKAEEASAAPDAAQAPQTTEATEPAKSEEPEPAVPAAEAPAATPTEPESSGPTQVEEPAAAAPAEAAPAAERPRDDNHPETPRSEGTEVTPNAEGSQADAEANGTEEKQSSAPSDKKKKGFLKALFSRFRSRISSP